MIQANPGVFRKDNSILFCNFCEKVVEAKKISQVTQHIGGKTHEKAAKWKNANPSSKKTQSLITDKTGPRLSEFNADLCRTFLEANIPLYRVNHPSIIEFIKKYTNRDAPDESTLRRNYLPNLYDEAIEKLRAKAAGKHIWVSLDETTDVEQRMVANFVFGILDDESERGKSYLLNTAQLEKTNANTVATFFTDSLLLLWPKGKFSYAEIIEIQFI